MMKVLRRIVLGPSTLGRLLRLRHTQKCWETIDISFSPAPFYSLGESNVDGYCCV